MALRDMDYTSDYLAVSKKSLVQKSYRDRIGLPAIRVGHKWLFDDRDIEAMVERNRESLAAVARTDDDVDSDGE